MYSRRQRLTQTLFDLVSLKNTASLHALVPGRYSLARLHNKVQPKYAGPTGWEGHLEREAMIAQCCSLIGGPLCSRMYKHNHEQS